MHLRALLRRSTVLSAFALGALLLVRPTLAHAIINQVDGTIVPQTGRMQACLDKSPTLGGGNPAPGEGAGVLDAVRNAAVAPQTFLPAARASDGRRIVRFTDIGEGAGYQNRFGWYNVGDSPFVVANRREIYDCRTTGSCDCPCNAGPRAVAGPAAACTTWINPDIVELDFDCLRTGGAWRGGPVAFYIMTPELITGGSTGSCAAVGSTTNRVYSTDNTVNDDGDYVHFLIYNSRTFVNSYYFGWEDLFRGGDNDFEDMLIRADGLVPTCNPTPEVCDGRDNNCNGMTDEGLGTTTCGLGVCRRTVNNCAMGMAQTCTPLPGSPEICDNLDNDCNGMIDEGVTRACVTTCGAGVQYCSAGVFGGCVATRSPSPEVCDNVDNDCNGMVDDGLSRPCSTICGPGTERCTAGMWGVCSAPSPAAEVCDGLDNNCNGIADDGVATRPCMSMCGPGTERCIGGRYVCDAPGPGTEVCNGRDDDCDGMIDEDVPPGGACGRAVGACRAGAFVCEGGMYVCRGTTAGSAETCNNIDDDCNGIVDDGIAPGGPCNTAPDGTRLCMPGQLRCREGMMVCEGGTRGSPEICDCMDNDCNGIVDDVATGGSICGGGAACVACMCRRPCRPEDEFPCSAGLVCRDIGAGRYFCVPPQCGGRICADGEVCEADVCVDPCSRVMCNTGQRCVRGTCLDDNCYNLGCSNPAEVCIDARCQPDRCRGVTCEAGQFCRDGMCIASCVGVSCEAGQRCREGRCVDNACAGVTCPSGQNCVVESGRATCTNDPCANRSCGQGRRCEQGNCVDDPCARIVCPAGVDAVCRNGQCESRIPSERPSRERGYAAGAGGAGCAVRGGGVPTRSTWLGLAVIGIAIASAARRRWRRVAVTRSRTLPLAPLVPLALLALAMLAVTGCRPEPYCFNCRDATLGDAEPDRVVPPIDTPDGSCVPGAMEVCNGRDDDCDGMVDEDFNLQTDPANCGMCGMRCSVPHALPNCVEGRCGVRECDPGYHDLDRNPLNGCEYACTVTGAEVCDGMDNNCDGRIDEGIDTQTDRNNCGRCGNVCNLANATGECRAGVCQVAACDMGFHDPDMRPDNGCEYACVPSGPETCDARDNDCNGRVDEGFDLMNDPRNCGACGRTCNVPNGTAGCTMGMCTVIMCATGYADDPRTPALDCNLRCGDAMGRRGPEACDGLDNDCNGLIDDGMVMGVGAACGATDVGECQRGAQVCDRGVLRCVGEVGPSTEICDGRDNDCDAATDELPLPGVGGQCGSNVGACSFGMLTCTGGAIVCAGGSRASAELCDGVDNDCNGRIDDGVTAPASLRCNLRGAETTGVCALATRVCSGATGWRCTYPPTFRDLANEAYCDGLDNNCDGRLDEACLVAGAEFRLDQGVANSIDPSISANGTGSVGIAYLDRRSGRADIYFARSLTNGASWLADLRLDTDAPGATDSVSPAVLWLPGGTDVYAAWSDFRASTAFREIRTNAARGTSGATWLAADVPTSGGGADDRFNVRVVTTAGQLVAVWEALTPSRARHIFYNVSADRGATWGAPAQLDRGPATAVASTPSVAVGQAGRVFVAWRDNRNGLPDIYFHAIVMGVASPGGDLRLDTDPMGVRSSESPSVAADASGNVYVAWQDVRTGSAYDIYVNRSVDGGVTFMPADVRVDTDAFPHDSLTPTMLAMPGGAATVVWQDFRWGLPNVYASRSTDRGATWLVADVAVMAGLPGRSRATEVTASSSADTVFAVWSDNRSGRLDIFANFSLDGGLSFQPNDIRLDTGAAGSSDSQTPRVTAASGVGHVVWVDRRSDGVTGDIYYRSLR